MRKAVRIYDFKSDIRTASANSACEFRYALFNEIAVQAQVIASFSEGMHFLRKQILLPFEPGRYRVQEASIVF